MVNNLTAASQRFHWLRLYQQTAAELVRHQAPRTRFAQLCASTRMAVLYDDEVRVFTRTFDEVCSRGE